jgi:ATP adenylyltransferase
LVLPKGHIEAGEAAWQTAVREVDEEMGLEAEIRGWAGSSRITYGGEDRHVAYFAVEAQPGAGFARHLGGDTLLFEPDEAIRAVEFDSDRARILAALEHLDLAAGSAS